MVVELTPSQARALGIDVSGAKAKGKRTTRTTARGVYRTRCVNCGELFDTRAGEDRHVDEAQHWRYELVLEDACHGRPSGAV